MVEMNKNTQDYVVFSNGVALPGSDLSGLRSKLSALYKMSESDIDRKLLNRKPTKIKSFDEHAKAARLAAQLTKLGLNCYITSPQNSESVSPKTNSKKWSKWFFSSVAVLFIVAAGLYLARGYFTNKLLSTDLPSSVWDVESALFLSQKQSMLMQGNLQQLRTLLSVANDSDLDEKSLAVLSKAPLLKVFADSEPLLAATDIFTAGASLNTKNQSWITILQGSYSSLNSKSELEKTYKIETVDNGVLQLTLQPSAMMGVDNTECPIDESDTAVVSREPFSIFAVLRPSQIIFSSSPEGIASFVKAYSRNEVISDPQLANWQEYRAGSLFAMSVFDENLLKKDFIGMAASGTLLGGESYESLGVKASVLPIKQALQVSFDANMNNGIVAEKLATNIQDGIEVLQSEHAESFPAVINLLSRIGVESDEGLHLNATLDKTIVAELESVVSDFFSMIFSGASVSQNENKNEPVIEQLDEYVWDFALNEKVFESTPLPADNFTSFLPIAKNAEVSIFMKSVGVEAISSFDAELGEALQLSIDAKRAMPLGDAFFGWSSSGIKQNLSITSVFDRDGNELMVDERCIKARFNSDLNHQASSSTNYSNGVIQTQKRVRLIDVVDVTRIQGLKGHYELIAPVDVVTKSVSMNSRDAEWAGGSFTLSKISDGEVSYILNDNDNRLLDVRGLNAKGQVLSMGSGMSVGKQFTKNFKGQVDSIQLLIAGSLESQNFDFTVDSIIPTPVKNNTENIGSATIAEPIIFNKASVAKFSKAIPFGRISDKEAKSLKRALNWRGVSLDGDEQNEIGRVSSKSSELFFSHDQQSNWNHALTGVVLLPFDEALQFADGLVSLTLNIDGEDSIKTDVSISRTSINGKAIPGITLLNLGYDTGSFSVPFKEKRSKVNKIDGVIEYTLPLDVEVESIDMSSNSDADTGLEFKSYDFTWKGRVTYQLNDALSEAYFVKMTALDGTESKGKIEISKDATTVVFETAAQVKEMHFYFIKKSHVVTETFTFKPIYK